MRPEVLPGVTGAADCWDERAVRFVARQIVAIRLRKPTVETEKGPGIPVQRWARRHHTKSTVALWGLPRGPRQQSLIRGNMGRCGGAAGLKTT